MYLVIDIGGSSVKSAIWHQGELLEQEQFPSGGDWEEMLGQIIALKERKSQFYRLEAVSFSLPGIVNEATGVLEGASSLAYLHGFAFREVMSKALDLPVYMENDANCAALAEQRYGVAKKKQNVLFVVIGTGIGGTIISDGQIRRGHHLFGGEFGMMLINGHDEWAILGSAVHMARKVSLAKGLSEPLSGQEIFRLADEGDQLACEAVEELYHYLALGIYNLQYIIDPEMIVLGGGISAKAGLIENIQRHLALIMDYGQRSPLFPKLALCKFGNEANLIGAAITAMEVSQ
ncbi:ROK family protein [uncultured Vagococcus sp.]|uniref:ROK family protein n=1 Tax=uncultured Vagococcus sp. TaxID=189676 RepID=UPI0028D43523|nr:ROK family protein [uncultured Vagococcus sp.]